MTETPSRQLQTRRKELPPPLLSIFGSLVCKMERNLEFLQRHFAADKKREMQVMFKKKLHFNEDLAG